MDEEHDRGILQIFEEELHMEQSEVARRVGII
jgi:DNA-binding Lrp family transcriptional regulator